MEANQYHQILEDLLPWAQQHLPATWRFQQDNDPKHKSGLMMGKCAVFLMDVRFVFLAGFPSTAFNYCAHRPKAQI
jgi:hypothetical protein